MGIRLIALDMDGTLLNRRGQISVENLAAIAAAQRAGVMVVPCTGRAWVECQPLLKQFPRAGNGAHAVGVFVGGAAVSHLDDGQTLDLAVLEPHLAMDIVNFLAPGPEAVLVFRDANFTGHDYMVTGQGQLTGNTAWWFEYTGARHVTKPVATMDDMHHTLRVGLVTQYELMLQRTKLLQETFGDQVLIQSFAGLHMPHVKETFFVLEVFARGVDKWRGLTWLAAQHGIDGSQIAVLGDEINDLAMFQNAGCPIAMGNAIEPIKKLARHVTLDCDESGVAHAIGKILAGEWS